MNIQALEKLLEIEKPKLILYNLKTRCPDCKKITETDIKLKTPITMNLMCNACFANEIV